MQSCFNKRNNQTTTRRDWCDQLIGSMSIHLELKVGIVASVMFFAFFFPSSQGFSGDHRDTLLF